MKNPRILITNENKGFGGAEIITLELALNLISRGFFVILACRPKSKLHENAISLNIPYEIVEMRNEIDLWAVFQLLKIVSRKKIDIIHSNATRDHVLSSIAVNYCPKINLIKTEHSFISGKLSHLALSAYKNTDFVVCVSNALRESILKHKIATEKLKVIYNGIEPEKFASIGHLADKTGKNVGMIGHLLDMKGQIYFLRAAKILLEKEKGIEFYIAGTGPDLDMLKEESRILGIEEKVHFKGYVADIPSFMSKIDVLVVPSIEETFGLVILEAFASRVPVVAFDTGGISEIISDKKNGLLIGARDIYALSEKIGQVLHDDLLKNSLTENAFTDFMGKFTLNRMIDDYVSLYNKCRGTVPRAPTKAYLNG